MTGLKTFSDCKKDDLIVITGAGGFIAGALARYFHERASRAFARWTRSRCPTGTRSCPAWRASAWT